MSGIVRQRERLLRSVSTSFSRLGLPSKGLDQRVSTKGLCVLNPTHHNSSYSELFLAGSGYCQRFFSTWTAPSFEQYEPQKDDVIRLGEETDDEEDADGWGDDGSEEDEPQIGDGGDGGGVVLLDVAWGERVLSIANEVLTKFEDLELFAFKISHRGYVFVRLDKLSDEYGCPRLEELETYCQEFRKRLDEVGAVGEIPDNLAVEVSSPSVERLLRVPDDLVRFKDLPMRVSYVDDANSTNSEKEGVFSLESLEIERKCCIWKLAEVKENRDPASKGRPMNRKMREWRLKLPFDMHRKLTLYIEV